MSLWNKYNNYHPEIVNRLERLDKSSREKFIKKLKSEKDENNFSATLTELSFFETFFADGFEVEYEKQYCIDSGFDVCPDLSISKDGQSAIVEVVKLNPTKKDSIRNDFESFLMEEIEKIQIGCWLQIDYISEYFESNKYNIQSIVAEIRTWLSASCIVSATLRLYDNFTFKIIRVDNKYSHVCVIGNVNSVDIDLRRLNSLGSRFIQKISKYSNLIDKSGMPYIICIKIDFHAGIGKEEMVWTMYGDQVEYYDGRQLSELNGAFYTNEHAKKYLSGVLLMVGGQVYYYHNYQEKRLHNNIKSKLMAQSFVNDSCNKLVYQREVRRHVQ